GKIETGRRNGGNTFTIGDVETLDEADAVFGEVSQRGKGLITNTIGVAKKGKGERGKGKGKGGWKSFGKSLTEMKTFKSIETVDKGCKRTRGKPKHAPLLISTQQLKPNFRRFDLGRASILDEKPSTFILRAMLPEFFNQLYNEAYVKEFHYLGICNHWWPTCHAFHMHNYFGKPWGIVSQVSAIIILTLTTLQTVYFIVK
ncbi:hypothetical protein Gohar_020419, partial [Gossypium harknessii]|nr:hypothetical protein [Gossypium harknessii]